MCCLCHMQHAQDIKLPLMICQFRQIVSVLLYESQECLHTGV